MRTTATTSLPLPLLGGLRRALPAPAVQDAFTAVPDHVAVGPTARVLRHVKRRGKNLAIWLRQPKNAAAFDGLKDVHVHLDVHGDVDALGPAVDAALAPRKELPAALARALCADVRRLAVIAMRLEGTRLIRAKVHTCDGDECRQFHVDHVGYRLITTYAGPGTDWLEDGAARREHLGGRGLGARCTVDAVNNAIVADWTRVHRLPRFAVAAFRGGKRVDDGTGAIVHRSPPIAGTGIRRLRLVVEAADASAVDACAV